MIDIIIPKMGMSTVDVDVVAWHVAEGDRVEVGSPLADIESEKASTTIESHVAGVVAEICVTAGQISEVGSILCRIAEG